MAHTKDGKKIWYGQGIGWVRTQENKKAEIRIVDSVELKVKER